MKFITWLFGIDDSRYENEEGTVWYCEKTDQILIGKNTPFKNFHYEGAVLPDPQSLVYIGEL